MSKTISLLVIGAGGRGSNYCRYADNFPEKARVVGVAEPRKFYRESLVKKHEIRVENVFTCWKEAAQKERFADAVMICTQDSMHAGPAVAFAAKGYHVLLEKPMATKEADCRRIVKAVKDAGVIFAVCHVLRYTNFTRKLKELVETGLIGEIVSVQHLEPVGYWHQAHSYVRGKWRNEAESSCMLLAKSCHDLDWILYIVGKHCLKVSSFGNLKHFRKEEKPAGAADRCLDCALEPNCPYSAKKIYLGRVANGHVGWPVDVLAPVVTEESITEALRTGPYGRCVYACDNDVVDHQVVNMLFEGGATANFTMTAFNRHGHRKTNIFGTLGEIYGDGETITHFDFLTDKTQVIEANKADSSILGGHGGGDFGIMQSFIKAVAEDDQSRIISGPDETLESHLIVFAAEKARHHSSVEEVIL